jgi:DNA-binding NtrC family response regulator
VKEFIFDALQQEYDVTGVNSGNEALESLASASYDMVITDVDVRDMSGEELIGRIKERCPDIPVVAVTAFGSGENANQLMNLGAFDYVEKPFTIKRLRHVVEKTLKFTSLENENRELQKRLVSRDHSVRLVGNSVQMQHVNEKIRLVANTNATVLIAGENGVGKKLIAQEIHRLSGRSGHPLVKVNCGSLPTSILETELFGDERSTLTGSVSDKRGMFTQANRGTILLNEIGLLENTIQAKLLEVIQEGEFRRIGGTEKIKVDVRIIATTNRNLKEEIGKGRFREDLYYKLAVVPLDIPPLRERREDIPLLIKHFVALFAAKSGHQLVKLTDAAVDKLACAYWKGNVQQLENIIERATLLRSGATLDSDYFQFENDREEQLSRVESAFRFGTVREMEKLMILNRLKDNEDNRTRSAETLDISVRTLRNKLNEYNVPKKRRQNLPK